MKVILSCFLLIILTFSCQMKQQENADSQTSDKQKSDGAEMLLADTVQATAIFWIDKAETKHCKGYGFRTIKAKVFIREDGKVDLLTFVKRQSVGVEKYIRHHLSKFEVSDRMFETGLVQPGEQFVQLRCLYDKLEGK